jgi:hypothetical protein
MLGNRKLVLDTFCEVYDQLEAWADDKFWDFSKHELVPDAIYLIGRQQFISNIPRIREITEKNLAKIILSNPTEGSETLAGQCVKYGVKDLVLEKKIILIGGGAMDSRWPCLHYDSFLPKILDYDENINASTRFNDIYTNVDKPYKFLFLNGVFRPHRKYLIDRFQQNNLLDSSIWTCLDRAMAPVHYLESKYEYKDYVDAIGLESTDRFVKHQLFKNTWGDIYINPLPYVDTYFSLVTETVFDYPHSFRTEKIWKPIIMGHPWIAVANCGYYNDMHNLGFQTFGHVIDESFDQIENNQDRLHRIAQVVEDLCQQDLVAFLKECYNVCKYNQQHLAEMRIKVRQEFPYRFSQFINQYQFNE